MINLLTPSKSPRTSAARAFLARVADRFAGLVAEQPAPSVVSQTTQPAETPAVAVSAPVDLPELPEIEAAAAAYNKAADAARAAERAKRKANKVLSLVPAGRWGAWLIERVPSGRSTVDLDAVRAHYKALGLEVPMKSSAPSLKVSRAVDTAPNPELAEAELLALAGAR